VNTKKGIIRFAAMSALCIIVSILLAWRFSELGYSIMDNPLSKAQAKLLFAMVLVVPAIVPAVVYTKLRKWLRISESSGKNHFLQIFIWVLINIIAAAAWSGVNEKINGVRFNSAVVFLWVMCFQFAAVVLTFIFVKISNRIRKDKSGEE